MTDGTAPSERTCVVCRQQRPREQLLSLAARDGVLGFGRPLRGRGAYVCAARRCIESLDPRSLSRAFRRPVRLPEDQRIGSALLASVHALAERRVLEAMGLARRQGDLTVGDEALAPAEEAHGNGKRRVAVAARDLSERTLRRAQAQGAEPFLDAAALGRAVGMGRVGLASLRGRMADEAAYWLRVWRETTPTPNRID